MKLMKTEDAIGQVLCHDITQIIPGVTKDAVFRKGHIITEEDIPVLLSVGKEHIYIWEKDEHIAAMVRNNLAFMERILKHSEARYEVVNEEKSFEKSLIKVLQDLSPGITLMMRPFRLFPFYYPYTVRLYRKHARSEVLIIPRDDSLYIPCH